MDEPQLKANGSMVVLDLGKKRKKAIRQLRKGKGKLLKRLHASLEDLRTKTRLTRITNAGLIESHPHDVIITKEAPNYQLSQR